MSNLKCMLCQDPEADLALERLEVWQDDLWRLTMSLAAEVRGFCYLDPKRHIPDFASLDGEEAATLGAVMAKVSSILKEEQGAENVIVYIFDGSIPYLNIHLALHSPGDALEDRIIKGDLVEDRTQDGVVKLVSKEYPILPVSEQRELAWKVQKRLSGFESYRLGNSRSYFE